MAEKPKEWDERDKQVCSRCRGPISPLSPFWRKRKDGTWEHHCLDLTKQEGYFPAVDRSVTHEGT